MIKIPTGDGITLVFYHSPEAPVECALEISRALKKYPEVQLRMGIHSGPCQRGHLDAAGKANVAGAGINMAQRVMDCGDAGHILLSKHVAEDLEEYPDEPHLHELGECEVKHGVRLSLVKEHLGARASCGSAGKAEGGACRCCCAKKTGRIVMAVIRRGESADCDRRDRFSPLSL